MSESGRRRHGLEQFLTAAPAADDPGVSIAVRSGACFINLRGDPADSAFTEAVAGALGQELPLTPNTFSTGACRVYWLGPDEWLVTLDEGDAGASVAALDAALTGRHAAINDVTGGNVALRLQGPDAREILAKGCTLDLHPDVFPVFRCAQSGLARANVLLALVDDTPAFEIVVRRSYADYLCRWLAHSARTCGVSFSVD